MIFAIVINKRSPEQYCREIFYLLLVTVTFAQTHVI